MNDDVRLTSGTDATQSQNSPVDLSDLEPSEIIEALNQAIADTHGPRPWVPGCLNQSAFIVMLQKGLITIDEIVEVVGEVNNFMIETINKARQEQKMKIQGAGALVDGQGRAIDLKTGNYRG